MKKKILDLAKSAVWFVLCLLVGALIFEGVRSLANSNEPAKKIGTSVFTEKGHDYLIVDTKHGVCVIHAESCPCHLDTLGIYVVDNKDTTYVIKKK
nr:MAG TPA: hypothetical protein [Caudoviricetes sp.]